jgi:hypothetical protein
VSENDTSELKVVIDAQFAVHLLLEFLGLNSLEELRLLLWLLLLLSLGFLRSHAFAKFDLLNG